MDEFLELNGKYKTIQNFLNDKIFKKCQNIKVNWLRNRFNNNNGLKNKGIKSTVRGHLPTNYWEIMRNPHTSLLNITSCSTSGKIIQSNYPYNNPPDYLNGRE